MCPSNQHHFIKIYNINTYSTEYICSRCDAKYLVPDIAMDNNGSTRSREAEAALNKTEELINSL